MRLWSIHPKYLDAQGLVALWREALLAQAVLTGRTRGYRAHPQLARFRERRSPEAAIANYLHGVHAEATARGYSFDGSKIVMPAREARHEPLTVMRGQVDYEWAHLMRKLKERNPELRRRWRGLEQKEVHPLFEVCAGGIEAWERPVVTAARRQSDRERG